MTLIEFFDTNHIDNIVGTLLCRPDKVVYVGSSIKKMKKCVKNYLDVVKKFGIQTTFDYCVVSRNWLSEIVTKLSDIIENEEKCVFNLNGGEDLYLVAAGVMSQKYKDKVLLRRYNVRNSVLTDCDTDENVCSVKSIQFSVEDNIKIYGGIAIQTLNKADTEFNWDFNEDFCDDIRLMWKICIDDTELWNVQITRLGALAHLFGSTDSLTCIFRTEDAWQILDSGCGNMLKNRIFTELKCYGLLYESKTESGEVSICFKNEQVRRTLTKAGQILELYISMIAISIKDNNDVPIYNDVKTGVYIDWDGNIEEELNVVNEIDVILMKDLVPVFISCKNGQIDIDELYKLSAVAERFGGKYAKKVLVASELNKIGERANYIKARAAELNIKILEVTDSTSEAALRKSLENIYK